MAVFEDTDLKKVWSLHQVKGHEPSSLCFAHSGAGSHQGKLEDPDLLCCPGQDAPEPQARCKWLEPLPAPSDSWPGKHWHPAPGRVIHLPCPAGKVNTGMWKELGQQHIAGHAENKQDITRTPITAGGRWREAQAALVPHMLPPPLDGVCLLF